MITNEQQSGEVIARKETFESSNPNNTLTVPTQHMIIAKDASTITHILMSGTYPHALLNLTANTNLYTIYQDNITLPFGTTSPITFIDQSQGPTKLRLFGKIDVRLRFAKRVIHLPMPLLQTDLQKKCIPIINQQLPIVLKSYAHIPELFSDLNQFSIQLQHACSDALLNLGFEITDLKIENITLPESDYQKNTLYQKLSELNKLHADKLLSDSEFHDQKARILEKLS